jgi:hypothetical protein
MVRLVYGYNGRPPSTRVARHVQQRIMAVPLPTIGETTYIPTVGIRRRLEALATLGWSAKDVARVAGLYKDTPNRAARTGQCTPGTYRAICDAYNKLWDKSAPTDTRAQRVVVARLKAHARRQGWVPPMAWDEDALDNPDARPDTGAPPDTAEQRQLERLALWRKGLTDREIAAATGRHHDAIRRWRVRHGLPHGRRTA